MGNKGGKSKKIFKKCAVVLGRSKLFKESNVNVCVHSKFKPTSLCLGSGKTLQKDKGTVVGLQCLCIFPFKKKTRNHTASKIENHTF